MQKHLGKLASHHMNYLVLFLKFLHGIFLFYLRLRKSSTNFAKNTYLEYHRFRAQGTYCSYILACVNFELL